MKNLSNILPIILAGGSGTRLWPLSRETFPKQYLNLSSDSIDSQFQTTIKRVKKLKNTENPLIICNEEHRFIVAEQCRIINVETKSIILEPFGKNTAPAITLAALKATEKNQDPILLILSSDHEIKNEDLFLEKINLGEKYALKNRLVTFGITPSSPETGFGYIKSKNPLEHSTKASEIENFIEKPEKELAEKLILDKKYTWNSGIFMFKASTIIEEIKKYNPSLFDICKKSIINSSIDLDFQRIDQNLFKKCPNISIDNAIMEKTSLGTVISFDADWSDLGSWSSIWENSKKDKNQNALNGDIILKDSERCYLRSENHLIVGLGLKDLIFIDSHDAILIAQKEKLDSLKEVVKDLKLECRDEAIIHKKVHRPWGNYTSIEEGKRWKVKTIEVKPGKSLSLQMHKKRAEHWVVVTGEAKVEIDNNIHFLNENESTFIPLGSKHRLSNPGIAPLILIEVQSGDYLGEDDIIRFQDFYGRANKLN